MKKNKLYLTRKAVDSFTSNPSTPDWLFKGEPEGGNLAKPSTLEAGGSPALCWHGGDPCCGAVSEHAAPHWDTPEV